MDAAIAQCHLVLILGTVHHNIAFDHFLYVLFAQAVARDAIVVRLRVSGMTIDYQLVP